MSNWSLNERTEKVFQFALERTDGQPELHNLHQELVHSYERLQQPMRVAIVGLIKAGKSTLMNALLGEAVVATGAVEATFNVNWFKYGEQTALRVHFKDPQREPEERTLANLEQLTRRSDAHRDYLLSIKYIEVLYPNTILETLNLIDTPGLGSAHKDDTENTRQFLHVYGDTLTETTRTHASNADAVLYLFTKGIATTDESVMDEFQGPSVGRATPINAIGVLTKVDTYWSDGHEPVEKGWEIAERLFTDHPHLRRHFYTIAPVCGLLAFGAQTMTAQEFETLVELASLPRFDRIIQHQQRFCEREYEDMPISTGRREAALQRMGQYGVWQAVSLIREGIDDQAVLTNKLLETSGLPALRDLIVSHFGYRAFLIKLNSAIQRVNACCFRERQRLHGTELEIIKEIDGKFEALETQEHAFQELRVLQSYYEGKLDFAPDEIAHLLEVTGEYGTTCRERLGFGQDASVEEMLPFAQERMKKWHLRANDPFGAEPLTLQAARVLARSYEHLVYHLQEAKKHLDLARKHLALDF